MEGVSVTDDDTEQRETRLLRKEIDKPIIVAMHAKRRYQKAAAAGRVDGQTRRDLQEAAIDLYNTLEWFSDEDSIEEDWEEKGLNDFGKTLRERREVSEAKNPRLSNPGSSRTQLAVAELSAETLVDAIEALLDIARDLGFAPRISKPTTRSEITKDDMEEFEEWRQQQTNQ